jgi:hypothetical protein
MNAMSVRPDMFALGETEAVIVTVPVDVAPREP